MDVKKLAVIGCGSMGGGMALLFAENGVDVLLSDPSADSINAVLENGKKDGLDGKLHKHEDYKSLCENLGTPRVIVFSLPHGDVADKVLDGLLPYLAKDDIILDCGNEHFENTERRQGKAGEMDIRYIGCGVSGGYQAARRGPSMCPGGDQKALEQILPFLEKVAAKDPQGVACVGNAGRGGSGHYIKMIHNGLEHAMMSAISEAFKVMEVGLGMSYDEIGDVFEFWNKEGGLHGTFLVGISADICRTKYPDSDKHVLEDIMDKVVQDITGEEGTGVWSNEQAVAMHISAPTLAAAHNLRLASAYRGNRENAHDLIKSLPSPQRLNISGSNKESFLNDLRMAVFTTCLAAYAQGIHIIAAANAQHKWNVNWAAVWQIWRGGCIIRADYISSILRLLFCAEDPEVLKQTTDVLQTPGFARDFAMGYPSLKKVMVQCTEGDLVAPALGATLEWLKYCRSTDLPAGFHEAMLDYFGHHNYDVKGESAPEPTEGKHHFEWKKA